eukprot:1144078-Pelagomonas_calceolata.AAC.5
MAPRHTMNRAELAGIFAEKAIWPILPGMPFLVFLSQMLPCRPFLIVKILKSPKLDENWRPPDHSPGLRSPKIGL